MRPFVGLIGVNDSRLDSLLKHRKGLSFYEALHDAAGFIKDCKDKGPGYNYAFRYFPLINCLFGHLTGLIFTFFVKIFHPRFFCNLEC